MDLVEVAEQGSITVAVIMEVRRGGGQTAGRRVEVRLALEEEGAALWSQILLPEPLRP